MDDGFEAVASACLNFWKRKLDKVMTDRPDLVVLPECATRPLQYQGFGDTKKIKAYYDFMGNKLYDLCKDYAKKYSTVFICCEDARLEDGKLYNVSRVIGPDGSELGRYCKNHLTIGEADDMGITHGTSAQLIQTPFGKIACAICYDLNFEALRKQYEQARPDLLVFSSMYHGGLQQSIWAYFCRCHFVGSMGVEKLPAEIRNPYGQVLYSTTNYVDSVVGEVNLDCVMAHLDYNWEKLDAIKAHYGQEVTVYDPGLFGSVLITSESRTLTAREMARKFEIELLDDYMARATAHRTKTISQK